METIDLAGVGTGLASIRAAGVMRQGGVILFPTDTLHGLGADAFSDSAVDKVYAIKGRETGKAMHAIFADLAMIEEYAEVNDLAKKLAARFLPGALTLVLPAKGGSASGGKKKYNTGILRKMQTIGVRIPDNSFCIDTARSLGKPFTATSANLAQNPVLLSVEEILAQLGKAAKGVDLVIDAGMLPLRPPSTVVDVSSGALVILRVGAIPRSELEDVL